MLSRPPISLFPLGPRRLDVDAVLVSVEMYKSTILRPTSQNESFSSGLVICYTRAFGDGPRNYEPWSSDQDDTELAPRSPNYHSTPKGKRLCSRQI
ncbi:hypothetical protein TNCV_92281 [Trichonephila clavipes]|nr:hypothetical protein TNCV_92281 [Trichonephila clavipes]